MDSKSIGSIRRRVCPDETQELLQVEPEDTEGCANMGQKSLNHFRWWAAVVPRAPGREGAPQWEVGRLQDRRSHKSYGKGEISHHDRRFILVQRRVAFDRLCGLMMNLIS